MIIVVLWLPILSGCSLFDPFRNVTDPVELNHAARLIAEKGKVNQRSLEKMLGLEKRALLNENGKAVPGGDVIGTSIYPTCGNEPFIFVEPRQDPAPATYRQLKPLIEENIDSIKAAIDSCSRDQSGKSQ